MRRLSLALIAAVSTIALTQIASAADLPRRGPAYVPPPAPVLYNWAGCYVGLNAGWARATHDLSTFAYGNINVFAQTAIDGIGQASLDSDGGFTGGGQVGCNITPFGPSSFVLGLEGDINWIDGGASRDTGNYVDPASGRTVRSVDDISMDWFSTLRGRVGWAWDRVLVYGTGGFAFAKVDASKAVAWSFLGDGCPIVGGLDQCHVGSGSKTLTGWTVGGGVEWAFYDRWSAKAEYLYADLGDINYVTTNAGIVAGQFANHTVTNKLQVVRVGLNYKFW